VGPRKEITELNQHIWEKGIEVGWMHKGGGRRRGRLGVHPQITKGDRKRKNKKPSKGVTNIKLT